MRSLRQFWTARRINEDRVILIRLGPLRLWMARAEKQWGYAIEHGEKSKVIDIAQVPPDVVPDNLNWIITLFKEAPREFLMRPTLPDRPVVAKPEHTAIIPQKESGLFHLMLPVFIELVVSTDSHEVVLGTIPSRLLSDTWFGSPTEGEFCYAIPQNAQQDFNALDPHPHHILCPVDINNHSAEILTFEKFCLRPQYVGLYCGDSFLWSSPIHITHEGSFKGTEVRYGRSAPESEEGLMELAKPRKREERVLSRLTFGSSFKKDAIFGR